MKTITGVYFNGKLKLDKPFKTDKPIRVTVAYNEEDKGILNISDFSFKEMQELLKECKTSFSDEIIEERRQAL